MLVKGSARKIEASFLSFSGRSHSSVLLVLFQVFRSFHTESMLTFCADPVQKYKPSLVLEVSSEAEPGEGP